MSGTFARCLLDQIAEAGERPFWTDGTHSRSYADLQDRITRLCDVFDRAGLREGDVILSVTGDDWCAFTLFAAALLDGKVPVVLAGDAGSDRVTAIQARTDAKLIVTDPARATEFWAMSAMFAGPPAEALAVTEEDFGQSVLEERVGQAAPRAPSATAPDEALAYLLFTSGTTSAPKGVMITHGNLRQQLGDVAGVLGLNRETRLFNALVLAHTDGLIQGPLLTAWTGGLLVRPGPFALPRLAADLALIGQERVTHMLSVPAAYAMILRHAPDDDTFRTPDFRVMVSTAAPLSVDLWDRLEDRFGTVVVNEYGMTETVAATHFAGAMRGMGARHGIGLPVGCRAELRDAEGRVLGDGETGELWVRGGSIFAGYYGDAAATAEVLRDGWFRTGDLAERDAEGSYRIRGRLATALDIGGFRVLPEEIDEALARHPTVRDVKTVGLPMPEFGTVPVAAVVTGAEVSVADLSAHCRAALEWWKVPKRIVQVEALPRTASGKTELSALRDLLRDALALPSGDDMQDAAMRVLDLAAAVLSVDRKTLTGVETPDDVPGWDSFAHTSLALEIETAFGIRLRPREVLGVQRLSDFVALVEAKT